MELFFKVWKDAVWSKVIATIIISALALIVDFLFLSGSGLNYLKSDAKLPIYIVILFLFVQVFLLSEAYKNRDNFNRTKKSINRLRGSDMHIQGRSLFEIGNFYSYIGKPFEATNYYLMAIDSYSMSITSSLRTGVLDNSVLRVIRDLTEQFLPVIQYQNVKEDVDNVPKNIEAAISALKEYNQKDNGKSLSDKIARLEIAFDEFMKVSEVKVA